ncbi:ATP-binding protein [Streptomyces canus]|uniref:ATP-binding protein n=1 Tax=Streptomyces canus TaxID=58343 RepID=UPI00367711D8
MDGGQSPEALTLIGRQAEQAEIDRMISDALAGTSRTLVVSGGPGIGKTALLAHAVTRAHPDMIVLRACGVESEAKFPFCGLHELLRPLQESMSRIPAPQGRALGRALALGAPQDSGPLDVAAATFSLVEAAAECGPLLIAVDDVHWLDASSRQALFFTARRLAHERVAVLIAGRETDLFDMGSEGVTRLDLAPLDESSCWTLLEGAAPVGMAPAVRERVLAAAAGNPLALTEIPRSLTAGQLGGLEPIDTPLPVGPALCRAFGTRVMALPTATREALLIAAACDSEDLAPILTALQDGADALHLAEAAGLLSIGGGQLRFRHPLVRSVLYYDAAPHLRRAAHRTLADALSGNRRAWHLAAAAVVPDEDIASALEAAALHACKHGGPAEAAAAYERAAHLSPDDEARAGRLREAAQQWIDAGALGRVSGLLNKAAALNESEVFRADLCRVRARMLVHKGRPATAYRVLKDGAAAVERHAPRQAVAMHLDGAVVCLGAGDVRAALTAATTALEQAHGYAPEAVGMAQATLVTARVLRGKGPAGPPDALLADGAGFIEAGHTADLWRASVLMWSGRYDAASDRVEEVLARADARGALGERIPGLTVRAELRLWRGAWAAAGADAAESERLAGLTGGAGGGGRAVLARLAAARGRREECQGHLARLRDDAERSGRGLVRIQVNAAEGLLELSLEEYEAAAELLTAAAESARSAGLGEPRVVPWAPDLIESLMRTGRAGEAREVLRWLSDAADQTGWAWTRAMAARCLGLMSRGDRAGEYFETSVALQAEGAEPFDRARSALHYGQWLRRDGQRDAAAGPLRSALATFTELEAPVWADRAHAELRSCGIAASRAGNRSDLTRQERKVAHLAARGLTNREVAARLFLSVKTVEFHLANVYRKWGVRSRTELVGLLGSEGAG